MKVKSDRSLLSLLEILPGRCARRHIWALYQCECGNIKKIKVSSVVSMRTLSCGCLTLKHGHKREGKESLTHRSWRAMRARVLNKNNNSYPRYGGRGIGICSEWEDFRTFLLEMGPRPGKQYVLDRIDNDGDYCKENCRWITIEENTRKRWTDAS